MVIELSDFLDGRGVNFQERLVQLPVHPTLEEPQSHTWDEGPPMGGDWSDVDAGAARISAGGDSDVRLELSCSGATMTAGRFDRRPGERFWGFGIRSDAVERAAGVVENWVGEGPFQLVEYSLISAITPRWAIRQRRDAAYFRVPWAMSSAGLGVLIDNSQLSWFRLADQWSVEVLADTLRLRLFRAGTPAELLSRFTEATGREPSPAAPWFFGPWCQTGQADLVPLEDEERVLDKLLEADAPLSAVETHMRRLPAGAHEGRREAERRRTALFHSRGLASLTYLNPFVSADYALRFWKAAPLLQRHPDGSPYLYAAYIGGREPPVTTEGQLDFTNRHSVDFFSELALEAIEDGHDGWMEDFGEYTPPDAVCADGTTGSANHNVYPTLFHAAGAGAASDAARGRPVARLVRSGWTGTAEHVPLVWGGDPTTAWGFDGLASAVTQGLSAGLSGIAFWGSDIGGFFTLGEHALDVELLIRWIQFGALSPLMRTKAEGVSIVPRARPQVWDPDVLPHWRRWAKFHTQLSPYLMAAAAEYVQIGMPLMRHMCLVDGGSHRSDQYLFGPDLLVAPVLEPGARRREVELPAGRWVDLWRSAAYEERSGGLTLGPARVLSGPAIVTLPAPLEEIPVLVRLGARIPMLPASISSLAAPHHDIEPRWLEFVEP